MQILQEHISAIHGGSNPAPMRDTVFDSDTQSMPPGIIYGTAVVCLGAFPATPAELKISRA